MLPLPILGAPIIIGGLAVPGLGVDPTNGISFIVLGALLFGVVPSFQTLTMMKGPDYGHVMSLMASDNGVAFTEAHANSRIDLSMVKAASETADNFLVHIKPAGFYIVPQRHSTSAEVDWFRDILRANVRGTVKLARP